MPFVTIRPSAIYFVSVWFRNSLSWLVSGAIFSRSEKSKSTLCRSIFRGVFVICTSTSLTSLSSRYSFPNPPHDTVSSAFPFYVSTHSNLYTNFSSLMFYCIFVSLSLCVTSSLIYSWYCSEIRKTCEADWQTFSRQDLPSPIPHTLCFILFVALVKMGMPSWVTTPSPLIFAKIDKRLTMRVCIHFIILFIHCFVFYFLIRVSMQK